MLVQLDLCSGVGAGFPLAGLITGGFQLKGLCEIDKFCHDRLRDRFPEIPIHPDVRSLQFHSKEFKIVSSSPPCQPFSVEGKRRGLADKRDCIPAVLHTIKSVQPNFFAIENVPGLLSCPLIPGEPTGSYFAYLLREI